MPTWAGIRTDSSSVRIQPGREGWAPRGAVTARLQGGLWDFLTERPAGGEAAANSQRLHRHLSRWAPCAEQRNWG